MLQDITIQEIISIITQTEAIAAPGDIEIMDGTIMVGIITIEQTETGTRAVAVTGPMTAVAVTTATAIPGTTGAAMNVVAPVLRLKEILRLHGEMDQEEIVVAEKEILHLHGVVAQEETVAAIVHRVAVELTLAEADRENHLHHGVVAQEVEVTVTGRQEWSQAEEEKAAARQEAAKADPQKEPRGVHLPTAEPDAEAETKS